MADLSHLSVSVASPEGRRDRTTADEGGNVTARTPDDEAVMDVVAAALAPYAWRDFTPEMVARLVVAANDRENLRRTLDSVVGATAGRWEHLVPAAADDPRLAPLLTFLTSHRWTGLKLPALCRSLLDVLGAEQG